MTRLGLGALIGVLTVSLAGCSTTLLDPARVEYKSAGKLPPLEIPPDLTSPTRDERFQVPDVSPTGSATYSVYNAERSGQPRGLTAIIATDEYATKQHVSFHDAPIPEDR